MRALSTHEVLNVWETGQHQLPLDRALTMLAFACRDRTREELASYSIAHRDDLLLDLRKRMLGPTLKVFAVCPHCNVRLEFTLSVDDIKSADTILEEKPLELAAGDMNLRFRLPTSTDLVAVAGHTDPEAARRNLAERCVLNAMRNDKPVEANALPAEIVTAFEDRIEEAGSQAEVLLDLTCPACGDGWQTAFDVASFFWEELQAEARRLLLEVHTLASAYGWREADILSLSPRRRQFYLDMVT